ncbi:MAG: DUF3892 domain-containing protein [Thiobacillaceae bacterium]
MASDQQLATLYAQLRAAFLSRHFALGRYFRTNYFSHNNRLATGSHTDAVLDLGVDDQQLARWDRTRDTDNPLLMGSLLLSCLAVEDALGQPHAQRILHSAVYTLRTLYKFSGNHFDGYPIRWDPISSDRWRLQGAQPAISDEFLVAQEGRYMFCSPSTDPRHWPRRSRDTLVNLMGEQEALRYTQADENKVGAGRWGYIDRYRRWEVSMDELVGLVLSYAMISKLTQSVNIRTEIVRQANNLGDYLAEHAWLLVRPTGGLNMRGATGVLPALEFPLNRALQSITGNDYAARTNFEGAMRKAGYWSCLSDALTWWTALGVVGGPLIAPLVTNVIATLGIFAFVPEAVPLAGIALPAAGIPAALLGAALPLESVPMARTYAIYQARGCFDVRDDSAAAEVAVAFLLMENVAPNLRFMGWMFGSSLSGGKGGAYAATFPPYIGLSALDDPDTTVRDAYLGWLAERRNHPNLEPDDFPLAEGCFASAVAILLGAGAAEEANLKKLLDQRWNELTNNDAAKGAKFNSDMPVVDVLNQDKEWDHTEEVMQPAMDFQIGLALAWLHAKRRADAGNPVTTAGFPTLPSNTLGWLTPAVPPNVLAKAQTVPPGLALPVEAIQGTPTPTVYSYGAELFDSEEPPLKPDVPAPTLPPEPVTLAIDKTITVNQSDGDVDTGIVLNDGDEYEISATGSIWAADYLHGNNGPNGWENDISWDATWPLFGALDPVNAHPNCLLGRLGGYFFIGEYRPRERFLYHESCPLWLRINSKSPGGGNGSFQVRIRVWSMPRAPRVLRISCVRRGAWQTLTHVGGVSGEGADAVPWMYTIAQAAAEIQANTRFYVERPDGDRAEVIVARSSSGRPYLRTVAGGGTSNNLGSLPNCA